MILLDDYVTKYKRLETVGLNVESKLYIDNDLLYKIYDEDIPLEEREKNIDRIINLNYIDYCLWPKEKIYINAKFSGIVSDYKKNYSNLTDVYKQFNFEQAINMGNQLSNALKQIHKENLIIGDIHGDNIITNGENSYFCDLDGMKMDIENKNKMSLYTIMYNDRSPEILDNQITDNIKLMVYILSTIYKYNFENILKIYGTEYMQKIVLNMLLDNDIKYILLEMFNISDQNIYFSDFSNKLYNSKDMIEKDRNLISNKVKFLVY